jgi:hypothetical protein
MLISHDVKVSNFRTPTLAEESDALPVKSVQSILHTWCYPKLRGIDHKQVYYRNSLVSTVSFEVVPLGRGYLGSQGDYFEGDGGSEELR